MKTLCVAFVVVLSLISVCQAASLACEKLVKPTDKGPDLSGTWHYIGISTEVCLASTLLNVLFWPSVAVDITAKDTPNIYDANVKFKMYGTCYNDLEPFYYANNSVFDVNSNNVPTGEADVLLQTGCPDCVVIKAVDMMNNLILLSRRKSVDAAELKEFEAQAHCLGWSKPQLLNTDHEYDNCKSIDADVDDEEAGRFFTKMYERLKSMHHKIIECIKDIILSYLSTSLFQK